MAESNKPPKNSSEFGRIFISLDKTRLTQEENITGFINLDITNDFSCNEIRLSIKGIEFGFDNSTEEGPFRETLIFLSNEFLVFKFDSSLISSGQYSFPFSLNVLSILPPSFKFNGNNCEGFRNYKLKGKVTTIDKKRKMTDFKSFDLDKKMNPLRNDPKTTSSNQLVRYSPHCCLICFSLCFVGIPILMSCVFCRNFGRTNITVTSNKINFYSDEEVVFEISLDNSKCSKKIKKVKFVLSETINIKSSSRTGLAFEHAIENWFMNTDVKAHQSEAHQMQFQIDLKDVNLKYGSSVGQCVDYCYFMQCILVYQGEPLENPNVQTWGPKIEIFIYMRGNAKRVKNNLPENWNPKIMPQKNLYWNEAEPYKNPRKKIPYKLLPLNKNAEMNNFSERDPLHGDKNLENFNYL